MIQRGTVERVSNDGALYVSVPAYGDAVIGPLEVTYDPKTGLPLYNVGDRVLVGQIGNIKEEMVVIGRSVDGIDPSTLPPDADLRTPEAATDLNATSTVYFDASGNEQGSVFLGWEHGLIATDGTRQDIDHFEVRRKVAGTADSTYELVSSIPGSELSATVTGIRTRKPDGSAESYIFGVRAVGANALPSAWVTTPAVLMTLDTDAPPVPGGVTAANDATLLVVRWDGTLVGDLPSDFSHIVVQRGESASGPWMPLGRLNSAGETTLAGLAVGSTRWFRAQSVDKTGNVSGWTTPVSATATEAYDDTALQQKLDDAAAEWLAKSTELADRATQAETDLAAAQDRITEAEAIIAPLPADLAEAQRIAQEAADAAMAAEARAAEASSRAGSLLANGNFESGFNSWVTSTSPAPTLTADARSGTQAAEFDTYAYIYPNTSYAVAPGQVWELSAVYKCTGMNFGGLDFRFTRPGEENLGGALMDRGYGDTGGQWKTAGPMRVTIPEGYTELSFRISSNYASTAKLTIDDVVLRDVTDVVRLEKAAQDAKKASEDALAKANMLELSLGGLQDRLDTAEQNISEAASQSSIDLAALDEALRAFASTEADAAEQAAKEAAALDAQAKANAAQAAAEATAQTLAQAEATAAQSAATAEAATEALRVANLARDEAIAAASEDAAALAQAAEDAAVLAAAADAKAKADAAQAEALRLAKIDATNKANAAQAEALRLAKIEDSLLATAVHGRIDGLQNTIIPALQAELDAAEARLTTADNAVKNLQNVVIPELRGDMNHLQDTTMPALEQSVADANTRLDNATTQFDTDLSTMETTLRSAFTQADIDALNQAALDAQSKADAAQLAAETTAQSLAKAEATAAQSAAIAAAATDALNKANAARDAAIASASTDAATKAQAAEDAAKTAAAADAKAKADAAQAEALRLANIEAGRLATTAQNEAVRLAGIDATSKANAAQQNAITAAATDAQTKFDQAKALADEAQAKADALSMAGDNLVLNGSGELKTLRGWPSTSLRLAPELAPQGTPNAIVTTILTGFGTFSSEQIVIDTARTYQMSAKMYGLANMYHYLAVNQYDVDGKAIPYQSANRKKAADTTLAAPVNPGDTTITLADASQWSGLNLNSIGWWPYVTQAGVVFEREEGYTQNLYRMNGFTKSGNVITLPSPWKGPALAAGTEVGLMGDGGSYIYPAARIMSADGWQDYSGTFGGGVSSGEHGAEGKLFRPGVATIGVGFLLNNSTRERGVSGFTGTRVIDVTAQQEAAKAIADAAAAQAAADAAGVAAQNAHAAAGNAADSAQLAFDRAVSAQTTAINEATSLANAAKTAAITEAQTLATNAAGAVPKVLHGTTAPAGTAPNDSIWYQHLPIITGGIAGQWTRINNQWVSTPIRNEAIANLDAGKITSGFIDTGRLNAQSVAAHIGTFIAINANQITAGTLDAARINVQDLAARIATVIQLNADRITSGTIDAGRINTLELAANIATVISLDASRITSGQITADRIAVTTALTSKIATIIELSADRIKTGLLSADRIDVVGLVAKTANIQTVRTDNIRAGTAVMDVAVAQKLFADIFLANKITAREMLVSNGNLFVDPYFQQSYSKWTKVGEGIERNGTGVQDGEYYEWSEFAVQPGDRLQVEATRKNVSGSGGSATIYFNRRRKDGTVVYGASVLRMGEAKTYSLNAAGIYTVPADTTHLRVGFWTEADMPSTTRVRIEDVRITNMTSAVIIKPNSITAPHINVTGDLISKFFAADRALINEELVVNGNLFANYATFISAAIKNLSVTEKATFAQAFADEFWSKMAVIEKLQAQSAWIGGTLLENGAVNAEHLNASNIWASASWLGVAKASSLELESTENGMRTNVSGSGLRVSRVHTEDDLEVVSTPIIDVGGGGENSFATYDPVTGDLLGGLGADGSITGTDVNVEGELYMSGVPVGGNIRNHHELGDNVSSFFESIGWGEVAYAFRNDHGNGPYSPGEIGILQTRFTAQPNRRYRIDASTGHIRSNGTSILVSIYYRPVSAGDFTDTSDPTVATMGYSAPAGMFDHVTLMGQLDGPAGEVTEGIEYNLLMTFRSTQPMEFVSGAGWKRMYLRVTDVGPARPSVTIKRSKWLHRFDTAPAPVEPPPVVVVKKTASWTGTSMRSYYKSGIQTTGQGSTMLKQGYDKYWPGGGLQSSMFLLPKSAIASTLSGSTVNKATLTLKSAYAGAGGTKTVRLYWHTATSLQSTAPSTTYIGEYTIGDGATRVITLPSSVLAALRAGSLGGFTLSPAGSTADKYALGISWKTLPKLYVEYTQ